MHGFKVLLKTAGWFWVTAAAICLLISLVAYFHTRSFVRTASRAQGTVIKIEERESGDSGKMSYPVYIFRDSQGGEHEIVSSMGSFPPAHKVGDTVTVLYRADQPEKAEINQFFDVWGTAAITGGLGAFNMIAGIALLVVPNFIRNYKHEPASVKTS